MSQKEFKILSNKRVLVLGGTGFIGYNLVNKLVQLKSQVSVVSRTGNIKFPSVLHYRADITSFSQIDKILKNNYDIIFHCAGRSDRISYIKEGWQNRHSDLNGTLNILNSIRRNHLRTKIILLGSRLEYGKAKYLPVDEKHPVYPKEGYAIEKLASALYTLSFSNLYNISCVILRISNVYGPHPLFQYRNYNLVNYFIDRARKGVNLIVYGNGVQLRDYIYIDDLIHALLLSAINEKTNGQIYNVGSGIPIKFRDFITLIAKKAGVCVVHKKWPKYNLFLESGDYFTNIRKITSQLNWTPRISYSEGIDLCFAHSSFVA